MKNVILKNRYNATSRPVCPEHRAKMETMFLGINGEELTDCPCAICAEIQAEIDRPARELARIQEMSKNAIYTRNRMGLITFYRADSASPSGVLSIGSVRATKENDAAICAIRSSLSPLSPTEGMTKVY